MIRLFFLRIRAMVVKELIQALRDPRMRVLMFLPPIFQLIVFGYAANLDLSNIPAAVYDEDRSALSRQLADEFSASGYFEINQYITDTREVNRLIDHGKVKTVLHFGPGFASRVKAGKTADLQIIVTGADSNTAAKVQSYAALILERFNQGLMGERLAMNPVLAQVLPGGVSGVLDPRIRVWYNPDLASATFYVPGIIGLIIMLITLILTSMSVVREKEIGTMEQIMVTPISPLAFILGKTIPASFIGILQVALVTSIGVLWFGVPMRGSWIFLGACLLIFLLSSLALGLLISTISRTQQQALITTFFFLFPAILLSGFIFPIANMPLGVQYVTLFNPLRYALVIIRGVFLKGAGLGVLWPQVAALLAIGLSLMAIAVKRVNKTLE